MIKKIIAPNTAECKNQDITPMLSKEIYINDIGLMPTLGVTEYAPQKKQKKP